MQSVDEEKVLPVVVEERKERVYGMTKKRLDRDKSGIFKVFRIITCR